MKNTTSFHRHPALLALACALILAVALPAAAQGRAARQAVSPPLAQAWIDIATFTGMGMPGMGGGAMPGLGALLGGGSGARNHFGATREGAAGRWMDVTLHSRRNPNLAEAVQTVPEGSHLAPQLDLRVPPAARSAPAPRDEEEPHEFERPRGRIHLYWGCGETVRAGQPRVLDMASASAADIGRFFVSRRATRRGAHSAAGRPVWPNEKDARMVPEDASLAGEHAFRAEGVPESFRFRIPPEQDLMPPIELAQRKAGAVTQLEWKPIPQARAWFVAAMGAKSGGSGEDMVLWTSSEVPETGMALIDYQTNAAVDRWLAEKVLLAPAQTRCAVPAGIFAEEAGAMLRMIAYGSELDLAHPPRPADPRKPWDPEWAVQIRVKSVASAMLGMESGAAPAARTTAREQAPEAPPAEREAPARGAIPGALDVLRGILGR
ncbi:MAG: hypothetical protein OHK0026_01920 [Rhodocyclaceae bacterium]